MNFHALNLYRSYTQTGICKTEIYNVFRIRLDHDAEKYIQHGIRKHPASLLEGAEIKKMQLHNHNLVIFI